MYNIKQELKKFKDEFDPILMEFFDRAIKEASKKDKLMSGALQHIKKITMSGGKRLRPALMYYGYLGVGGKKKKDILQAAISVELIHSFLLIHDDIIDRDAKRHGVMTTHLKYRKMHEKFLWNDDAEHFGTSMAIIIGDMVAALGNQALYSSKFEAEILIEALHKLQEVVANTVIGEAKDVLISFKGKATEEEILDVCRLKTAKYTIESPLHLGAILGEGNNDILERMTKLAIPIGIAFQIQDDILGVFGSEKKIGKPVGSDIIEGKQTILVSQAKKKANIKQLSILKNLLGKENLTKKEINNFRKIIVDTGALDYAKNLAQNYVAESKKEIAKISLEKKSKDFLMGIADYMMEREV